MRVYLLMFMVAFLILLTPTSAILDLLAKKKAIFTTTKTGLYSVPNKLGLGSYQGYYLLSGGSGSTHGGGGSISSGGSSESDIIGSEINLGGSFASGPVVNSPVTSKPLVHDNIFGSINGETGDPFSTGADGSSFDIFGSSSLTPGGDFDLVSSINSAGAVGGSVEVSDGITTSGEKDSFEGINEDGGAAVAYCSEVTLPVINDVTTTHFSTEYVTVPMAITHYIFNTIPFNKTVLVTNSILTTVTGPIATGLCTSTKIYYKTATVNQGQVISVSGFVTKTNVAQSTTTVTNTLTDTLTVTQTLSQTQSLVTTIIGSTVTTTRTSVAVETLTNTITSHYNVWTSSISGVGQPVWIKTTALEWLPFTITKTLLKTHYKTIWMKCNGVGSGSYGY
ncbi:hypothetical protein SK128_027066 [Halocaridina rubra]|uniref:Uncharacterized protein n=1 Tax=Halocaridina rubra TaxID=373956 RepID=A0AAN8X5J2_HALRR